MSEPHTPEIQKKVKSPAEVAKSYLVQSATKYPSEFTEQALFFAKLALGNRLEPQDLKEAFFADPTNLSSLMVEANKRHHMVKQGPIDYDGDIVDVDPEKTKKIMTSIFDSAQKYMVFTPEEIDTLIKERVPQLRQAAYDRGCDVMMTRRSIDIEVKQLAVKKRQEIEASQSLG